MQRRFPSFTAIAEHSLLSAFGETIAPDIHAHVLALDAALADHPCAGVKEAVPVYASLLIRFDPLTADHTTVEVHAKTLLDQPLPPRAPTAHEVGVCSGPDRPFLFGVGDLVRFRRLSRAECEAAQDG